MPRARSMRDDGRWTRTEPGSEVGLVGDVRAVAQLAPELAERAERLGEGIVLVNRLVVELRRRYERLVRKICVHRQRTRQNVPNDIFHEARIVMRLVDNEEFVRALEQIVRLARHRVLDDLYEIFGANLGRAIVRRADRD